MSSPRPSTTTSFDDGDDDENFLGLPFRWYVLVAIIVGAVVLIFLLCLCCCLTCCRRKKNKAKKMRNLDSLRERQMSKGNDYLMASVPLEEQDPEKGMPNTGFNKNSRLSINIKDALTTSLERSIESSFIKSEHLSLEEVIGSGQFGVVYKGRLQDKEGPGVSDVAVKTVQGDECTAEEVQKFLDEVMRMKSFAHPHVLSIIGICIRDNQPYAVLPFMDNGDLKSYLQNRNMNFTIKDLLEFGRQVAEGMKYLASQNFVHRDLAARNCMVDRTSQVKIADFGLSRDLYMADYYKMQDLSTPLPIKWMAVESIEAQKFSEKSDVWSFGILLWEIMTRGKKPYPGLSNVKVKAYIMEGKRLNKPSYTPNEIYELMIQCWRADPVNRPSFADLEFRIHEMLYGAGIEGKYKKLVNSPNNKDKQAAPTQSAYYNNEVSKGKKGKKK